jgi:peptide/nickel transport system substrate-binding protein
MSQVAEDLFRKLGMDVELVSVDYATLAQRRASKEPVDKGGWSAFVTGWTGADILNPAVHQMLRAGGATAWFGWPNDPALEALRDQWAAATDPAEQARLATAIQVEAFKTMLYVPLGRIMVEAAFRKTVTGVFPCAVFAYWNIGIS